MTLEIDKSNDSSYADTMAKMNHFGWRTLDVGYQMDIIPDGDKREDEYFLLTAITFKK